MGLQEGPPSKKVRSGDQKQKRRSEQMDTENDSDNEEGHGGIKGDLKEFNYSESLSHHVSDSAFFCSCVAHS